ncbi:hypothetical protein Psuf_032700 [Phytohabitans suffuscus]|uniref:Uncharacterized protein n=1 Tax=Phytohabitans suffuscus TaxID=624315 RepID=A0A6F8YIR0_9ACTN|nr:hypothetical protein Psuf_032700 [Phytohabitans suffuscus]
MSTEQPQVVSDDPTVPESSTPTAVDDSKTAETAKATETAKTAKVAETAKVGESREAGADTKPADETPARSDAASPAADPGPGPGPGPASVDADPAATDVTARAEAKDAPAADEGRDTPSGKEAEGGGDAKTEAEEPKTDEAKTDEAKNGETKTSETKSGETKADDTKIDEVKVPEEPPRDPFEAFSPEPERAPTRLGRVGRAVGHFLIHEWTLASLGSVVLAVLMTWPTLRYPLHTLPQDFHDPALQAWQMAWSGHILLSDPSQLWNSNTFFPERLSFAFSDTLLGYAPAGMIGDGPAAAILRYNIIFVLAHALATLGAYALVRQLGAGRTGAIVAGAAYTYAPWMLAQAGHLHIVSNGGIPLALAMLARGHGWSLTHGFRPERRHAGWAFAGWLVAAWQITLGFGIGLVFAYVLGIIAVVTIALRVGRRVRDWRVPRPWGARLVIADLVGGLIFAATGLLLALVYFEVAYQHPEATRRVEDLEAYSRRRAASSPRRPSH